MANATAGSASPTLLAQTISRPQRSLWRDAWHRLLRNKAAVAGACVVILFLGAAIFAPLVAPMDPTQIHDGKGFLPPIWVAEGPNGKPPEPQFLLGTDNLGRDVLSRLIYGARVSMLVGFIPVIICLVVGVSVGLFAGYRGGRVDNLLMRVADIIFSFPDLLFFIIVMAALRETKAGAFMNGLGLLFLALAIIHWAGLSRLVRGQVLSLKQKEFIEACRMVGARSVRIMFRHIFPNCLGPIIVWAAFQIPAMIITEATLGYLGLGLRPASSLNQFFVTSWGSLLLDGQTAINVQPYLVLSAAVCVAAVVLAFNYVGDGLRDALDPRLSGTR